MLGLFPNEKKDILVQFYDTVLKAICLVCWTVENFYIIIFIGVESATCHCGQFFVQCSNFKQAKQTNRKKETKDNCNYTAKFPNFFICKYFNTSQF